MESHLSERRPVTIREIQLSDEETLKEIAALMTKYSWGEHYPISTLDEIHAAEYIVGAYSGNVLAGFGAINRTASPDGLDNGELWFADSVVRPEYENQGIYIKIYDARMTWAKDKPGRIFCCVETEKMDGILMRRGWHKIRDTKDEEGNNCRVYEFTR